jgi:hypothetical protein
MQFKKFVLAAFVALSGLVAAAPLPEPTYTPPPFGKSKCTFVHAFLGKDAHYHD